MPDTHSLQLAARFLKTHVFVDKINILKKGRPGGHVPHVPYKYTL